MSPEAGMLLMEEVYPIVKAVVPRTVKPAVGEDHEELVQDTMASAARMMHLTEQAGRPILPRGVAFYAIQRAKTGRRSTYAGEVDALSAAAQIRGNVSRDALDENVSGGDLESPALHDYLADGSEDVAIVAGRRLDWQSLVQTLTPREIEVLEAKASARPLKDLARRHGVSRPRITQILRGIGRKIEKEWGSDFLSGVVAEPAWRRGVMRVAEERAACKYARSQRDG